MREPVVAYVSLRFMASQSASRVFSWAQTPANPDDTCCQAVRNSFGSVGLVMNLCVARCALGSAPECFPKKLSSSTATRDVWLSVEPTIPNL